MLTPIARSKRSLTSLNRAIHFDPKLHKDADTFEPARYLDKPSSAADYLNVQDPYERDHFTYGAGRRVCPGVHVAERSLYINIARVLWGCNIAKEVGSDGREIEPETAMVRGFLSVPKHFQADISVRNPQHANIIRDNVMNAKLPGTK